MVAAGGVGGGSLVYANINIRPDAVLFDDPGWPRSIDREALDPYYDRVAAMLTVAPVPQSIVLSKARPYVGRPPGSWPRRVRPDQSVAWEGPNVSGRGAYRLVTECEVGCEFGRRTPWA